MNARLYIVLSALLPLACVQDEDTPSDLTPRLLEENTEITIDCTSMGYLPKINGEIWSFNVGNFVDVTDEGNTNYPRCWFHLPQLINDGVSGLGLTPQFWEVPTDMIAMKFALDSGTYYATEGPVNVELAENNGRHVKGSYEVTAERWVDGSYEGNPVTIRGEFEWCDYVTNPNCPGAPVDRLEQRFSMATPFGDEGEGGVSECIAILDTTTGAFSVDMQFGTWRDYNVGRLMAPECTTGVLDLFLPDNYLRFEAGNTFGYGSHGPARSTAYPGRMLPSLSFRRPMALYTGSCQEFFLGAHYLLDTTVDSECTWELSQDGHVVIDCSNVEDVQSGENYIPYTGDAHFEMDCTLIER